VAGPAGPQGAAGTARAWARVNADGTLAQGVNIAGTTLQPFTGIYCVVPIASINPAQTAPVATLDFTVGFISTLNGGCSNAFGVGIQVNTYDTSATPANRAFFIAVP